MHFPSTTLVQAHLCLERLGASTLTIPAGLAFQGPRCCGQGHAPSKARVVMHVTVLRCVLAFSAEVTALTGGIAYVFYVCLSASGEITQSENKLRGN